MFDMLNTVSSGNILQAVPMRSRRVKASGEVADGRMVAQ